MGIQDIKSHIFFMDVDWDDVLAFKVTPPFRPDVENEVDVSYMDSFYTKERPSETPKESLVLKQEKFNSFTYTEKV